jgi:hypothetical protein|nr:MAG TPA: hypothetical protein [Myoviridae sp. ctTS62]
MEQTKTESQKLGEQILESLRKLNPQGVKIPGEYCKPNKPNTPDFDKIFEEAFKRS